MGSLASGNNFVSILQTFPPVPVFLSSSGNVFLKRILHSGYWKRIFWLVETIFSPIFQTLLVKIFLPSSVNFNKSYFLVSENHFIPISQITFHWKQFFHLVGIYFKGTPYYGQLQRIFSLVETIIFYS